MSIASEISRIQQAKADIKTAIEAKGVTVPSSATIDTYDDYVSQISGGGGVEPTYRWTNSGETYCDNNGDIQQLQVRELSIDSGITWYANSAITQEQLVTFQNCDCINNLKTDLSGDTLLVDANAQSYTITFYGIPISGYCDMSYVEFLSDDSWITADITQKQYPNSSGTVVVHIAANESGEQRSGSFHLHTHDYWSNLITVHITQTEGGGGGGGLESIPYGTDMSQYYNRYIKRIVIGDGTTSQYTSIFCGNWSDNMDINPWGVSGNGQFSSVTSLPIDVTVATPTILNQWSPTTNPFNYLQIEWA